LSSILTLALTEFGGQSTGLAGLLIMALNSLMIAVGLLIRRARAWIVALNVSAIALFIELTLIPDAFAVLFASMDAIVLFALLRHRAWFQWTPELALAEEAEAAAADVRAAEARAGARDATGDATGDER
jgi:hypothetical protein